MSRPHVLIIGAGFAGLYAARALKREPVEVTVLDRRNHHLFQPLLYQVATATLNPADIAAPIRHILRRQRNVRVILGEATAIDAPARRVLLLDGTSLAYDYLLIAAGAASSYFGRDAWEPLAPGLKTLEDALDIRRRILLAFEAAEREDDPARRSGWLNFVIVGAGPTGAELAGALAEIARHTLSKDFRRIDPRQARVILVEGRERVLPSYPEDLSRKAFEQLRALGVEVKTGVRLAAIDADGVDLGGERIPARTVIWAAGITASPLASTLGAPLDRGGRVLVRPDLSVPGRPEVFVAGDLAALEQDGKWVPGVCPAAIQMGKQAALNIAAAVHGRMPSVFRYRDKGSLATLGRAAAVADFGRLRLSGFVAWLAWLVVHIFFLIGFRNRLLVLIQWAWSYWTWDRGARLITHAGARRER